MSLSTKITNLSTHIATIMKAIANDVDKKENKLNWWSLVRGATLRELLSSNATGKKYAYHYGSTVLYRYIRADKTDDSFFSDVNLTTKIATKKVVVNI